MFVITIDYTSYGVPDEYAKHLLKTLSVLQPIKTDCSWDPKEFTFSDETISIKCKKVPDWEIEPSEKQKKELDAYINEEHCKSNGEPEIAEEKKKIVISETYDSPF